MTTRRALALAIIFLFLGLAACRTPGVSGNAASMEASIPTNRGAADTVITGKRLHVPFEYIAKAEVVESQLFNAPAKTLVIRFTSPQTVFSSLSGWSDHITAVGNHYASPPSWPVLHELGLEKANARTLALFGLNKNDSAFLYTGADMDNLVYVENAFEGFQVGVFATAGVCGNAMRASVDSGNFVEPGTINLIILTNRELSPSAMAGAVITATEAKTAALEDLDIRSSYTGTPATGTGTDAVLIVAGNRPGGGRGATMSGGHVKLGELIAKATYSAVRQAVAKQNGILAKRTIAERLQERKVDLAKLIVESEYLPDTETKKRLAATLEKTLQNTRYAGFMASALALSDSYERGLVPDTGAFATLCLSMANELAEKRITRLSPVIAQGDTPMVIRKALNALATGLLAR